MSTRTIAIIGGTGAMGRGLAERWARAGLDVVIGSRTADKASGVADAIRARVPEARVRGDANAVAAEAADVVVLSVPFAQHEAILAELRPALAGKVLVDLTAPLRPPRVDVVTLPPGGSAAVRAQEILGAGVHVVSAFQNVSARHLSHEDEIECDVLVTGDDDAACEIVIELARAAGLRAWRAGPLASSVAAESLAAVLIHINRRYKIAGAGVRITGGDDDG